MTSVIGTVTAADGTALRTRHWAPSGSGRDPVASVLLVHGLGEHSGRWEHVGEQLASEGLDVHAFDLRGFGASAGRRGHVDAFDEFYADVGERLTAVRDRTGGRPVVLYGHSLGGLVALGYVMRGAASSDRGPLSGRERPQPDLLVLSAPGLDSTIAAWKLRLAPNLGRVLPTLAIPNRLDGRLLSRDATVGQRFHADPLNVHAETAGFGATSLAEQAWVRSSVAGEAGPSMPTLVIHGEADELVPVRVSEPLGRMPNVTRRTYPGIRHELHNEPEGPKVIGDVIAWIREGVGGAEAAGPAGS